MCRWMISSEFASSLILSVPTGTLDSQRKPPPDYSIQKLRAYEEKLNDLRGNVSEAKRKEQLALWEAKSTLKAQRGLATAKLDELQWREDRDLARRRQALSKKLQAEDEALRQELSVTRETADERRAKLAEQATALAEARERRRREEADKLLTRAFRENYDPIRQVDSKLKTQRAAEERRAQVAEKLERRAQQEQEAAEWARVWDAQREKMEQRYHDDKDKEKKLNQETMRILDEQMSQYRARLARERQEEEDEIAALKVTPLRPSRSSTAAPLGGGQGHRPAAALGETVGVRESGNGIGLRWPAGGVGEAGRGGPAPRGGDAAGGG